MQTHSLHQFSSPKPMLKYALGVTLLLFVLMGSAAIWHKMHHVAQPEENCALCLTSYKLDHGLSSDTPKFDFLPQYTYEFKHIPVANYAAIVKTTGNRDPPFVI